MNQQGPPQVIQSEPLPPSSSSNQPHQDSRNSSSSSERSRSRSNNRGNGSNQLRRVQSLSVSKNEEAPRNENSVVQSAEGKEKSKTKSKNSKNGTSKEQKTRRKRPSKQLITDFTEFLPESLITVSRTNITSKVRIGERYQAEIPCGPAYLTLQRPMEHWRIWNGSSDSQDRPTEEHIRRFKEILGGNRNQQQLIAIRQRLEVKSWSRVLQWAEGRRTELRWTFHQAHRNKQ